MAHVEGEIDIARPVEEVFDFVADERNEPRYNPRMLRVEKLTPGPIGVGTRFRAEMKTMPRPAEMTTEFTGYDRPTRLASTTRLSTMEIRGTLTFRSRARRHAPALGLGDRGAWPPQAARSSCRATRRAAGARDLDRSQGASRADAESGVA